MIELVILVMIIGAWVLIGYSNAVSVYGDLAENYLSKQPRDLKQRIKSEYSKPRINLCLSYDTGVDSTYRNSFAYALSNGSVFLFLNATVAYEINKSSILSVTERYKEEQAAGIVGQNLSIELVLDKLKPVVVLRGKDIDIHEIRDYLSNSIHV